MGDRQSWVAWRYGDTWWIGRPRTWQVTPAGGESLAQAIRRTLAAVGVDEHDLCCPDPLDAYDLRVLLHSGPPR